VDAFIRGEGKEVQIYEGNRVPCGISGAASRGKVVDCSVDR